MGGGREVDFLLQNLYILLKMNCKSFRHLPFIIKTRMKTFISSKALKNYIKDISKIISEIKKKKKSRNLSSNFNFIFTFLLFVA